MFPALVAVLLLLALPSVGGPDLPWLPAAPWTLLPFVAAAVAWFALALCTQRSHPLARILGAVAIGVPFAVLALRGTPAGPEQPMVPFLTWVALAAALVVAALPTRARPPAAAGVLAYILAAFILGPAGLPLLPAAWWEPVAARAAGTSERAERADAVRGPLKGRAARARTALGEGEGPWWARADTGAAVLRRPVIVAWTATMPAAARTARWMWLDGSDLDVLHPLDVELADALWVGQGAWPPGSPDTPRRSAAIAEAVRWGGTLLVVRTADEPWPEGLEAALGGVPGGGGEAPPGEPRAVGLGRVVVVPTVDAGVEALLDRHLWVAEVGTAFDGDPRPPGLPEALARWQDDAPARRPAGVVLGLFLLATLVFTWAARDPRAAALVVGLAAAAAAVGVAWVLPAPAGHVLHALRLDLGGPGGRRVEAVAVVAGPSGFRGPIRWGGEGYVRTLGGLEVGAGEIEVAPSGLAWAVRATRAGPPDAQDVEDRTVAWLLPFLAGDRDPKRVRLGRGARLDVRVGGNPPPPAATLVYRPAR